MATMQQESAPTMEKSKSKRKGMFGRFRKSKKKEQQKQDFEQVEVQPQYDDTRVVDKREPTGSPSKESIAKQGQMAPRDGATDRKSVAKDGTYIVTADDMDEFRPSMVSSDYNKGVKDKFGNITKKKTKAVTLQKAPEAKDAAFSGPPRYDWIDIETAAATKLQAVARRNKAMADLEKEGKSTAAMRNRNRRRNAHRGMQASEDAPLALSCCGVGLLFGDATEEDEEFQRLWEKDQFEKSFKNRQSEQAGLRQHYHKDMAGRHISQDDAMEGMEVIEN